jgi:ferrous-iron efflux pump FieF
MKTENNHEYSKLSKRAVQAAVAVSFLLLLAKYVAWHFSGSATLLSSLTDSSLDLSASIFSFIVLIYALRPADDDHRFGHGKAEGLAALFQSGIVLAAGLAVLFQSVSRLINPEPLRESTTAIGVMIISLILTGALVWYQGSVYRKTNSLVVKADRAHYMADLLANTGAILALIAEVSGIHYADAIGGIVVSLLILNGAREVFSHAADMLLDHELADEYLVRFDELAKMDSQIQAYHDLKTRQSGRTIFFQVHLELDGSLSLTEAHEIADGLESRVKNEWPESECLVHMDPKEIHNKLG